MEYTREELLLTLAGIVKSELRILPYIQEEDNYSFVDMSDVTNFDDLELLMFVNARLVAFRKQQKLTIERQNLIIQRLTLDCRKLELEKKFKNS
jgi:hypothetical protein